LILLKDIRKVILKMVRTT